jgi:hypothetical protein
MKVRCAWCDTDLGSKEGPHDITHGMCGNCYESMMQEIQQLHEKESNHECTSDYSV